jgi:hypothetical protein
MHKMQIVIEYTTDTEPEICMLRSYYSFTDKAQFIHGAANIMKERFQKEFHRKTNWIILFLLLLIIGIIGSRAFATSGKQILTDAEDYRLLLIGQAAGLDREIEGVEVELILESIQFGSFSGDGNKEIFAIFKMEPSAHVGGLDRTLCVVYKADDLSVITSKVFPADFVQIEILPTDSGKNCILNISTSTSQGFSSQSIQLFKIEGTEWKSYPAALPKLDNKFFYILAVEPDTLLCLDYDGMKASYVYRWNRATESFYDADYKLNFG